MRSVVNISLPPNLLKEVNREIKEGGFASKSEFFRQLLRAYREAKLFAELEKSHKEVLAGKAKLLKSLKDLR
ncbi:MAG TPA: ribbon-helix-helix domain-containing protein [Candidatus Paceibacterota bacterium]|nr:ribbon-helix-helix domain-containing protein [Candidatus Paceibacterota bacterium]